MHSGSHTESDAHTDPALALVHTSLALVKDGINVLRLIEDDAQLRHPSVLMPGGSVGKHFRHVSETFDALLLPLTGHGTSSSRPSSPDGRSERGRRDDANAGSDQDGGRDADGVVIDYDVLLPASRQGVARDLDTCRAALAKVMEGLEALATMPDLAGALGRDVEVVAVTPSRQIMRSTLAREVGLSRAIPPARSAPFGLLAHPLTAAMVLCAAHDSPLHHDPDHLRA